MMLVGIIRSTKREPFKHNHFLTWNTKKQKSCAYAECSGPASHNILGWSRHVACPLVFVFVLLIEKYSCSLMFKKARWCFCVLLVPKQGYCSNGINMMSLIPKSSFHNDFCFLCASEQNRYFHMVATLLCFWSPNASCPNVFVNWLVSLMPKTKWISIVCCVLWPETLHVQNIS